MASGSEPVPISSLKHDPAWKHVQMFKNGNRVQLKCVYCLKLFSGGGIHRIKEHLACQKGNASCCSRVPLDVRRLMQQSLEGVVVKKKKKQKLAEEIRSLTPMPNEMESFATQCNVNTGLQLHVPPNMHEQSSGGFTRRDEGMRNRSSDRKKRGRVENSSPPPLTPDPCPIAISNPNMVSTMDKDQVHMAIGSLEGDVHDKIPSGMLDCIERLVPDIKVQDKINRELISYKNAAGDFGRKMAIRARHTLLPAEWWSTYGGECPNLARLAIRILSQTCSASGCKRNPIPFEQVHKTRNHLEHQRLCDLVFVQYNLRLQQIQLQEDTVPGIMDPISSESHDLAAEWVTEKEVFFGDGDSDWVALGQPIANIMPLGSPNDDREDWVAGFQYQDKRHGVRDDEDGNSGRH
ncbi:zinc finger protein [Macleaya cordata]|uniref:Zinc finger protein n=1 Tax=Macleaya cordata TaxID=56857 RepID=A0A200R526_MACCD|nr:zinc finger protein [Macleaya cordata]